MIQLMSKNFKALQQQITELNSDGNEDRGRYGEDFSVQKPWHEHDDLYLSPKERLRKEQAQDRRNG
jgi:hypothetical protein